MQHFTIVTPTDRKLRVRLAEDAEDIRSVQRLRYRIFCEEMGANTHDDNHQAGVDQDDFDALCDHLLVEDTSRGFPRVVGTYRLLRQPIAEISGGFYSASEYDIGRLLKTAKRNGQEVLELGRSCVDPDYRDSATIQLLWRGISDYLRDHRIGLMMGCASFHGIDADAHAEALSYLHHHHLAPKTLRAVVRKSGRIAMDRLPIGSYDTRLAARQLPPLIRAYLRVGAMVGDGAFLDADFSTIDVLMVMPVEAITARYSKRFAAA